MRLTVRLLQIKKNRWSAEIFMSGIKGSNILARETHYSEESAKESVVEKMKIPDRLDEIFPAALDSITDLLAVEAARELVASPNWRKRAVN